MDEFRSGFITILGRTNVGKSTLINLIASEKIAITTRKPQTTRTQIKAIINNEKSQMVFIDTPGIHKTNNKLGDIMIDTAYGSVRGADVILLVIDAKSTIISTAEEYILAKIKKEEIPAILIINKIDTIEKTKLFEIIKKYQEQLEFASIIPMSALKDKDISPLIFEVEKLLPIGPKYYEEGLYTDQTERQIVEEVIREKALKLLNMEVPHGIYIEVEKMKFRKTKNNEKISDIDATIYCNKDSHKGIIIGKDGQMLKRIGMYARQDLEKMLDIKINLQLWVKVKKDWQENDNIINKFKI